MALSAVTNPTLRDHLKTLDPNGASARTIMMMNQRNDVLDDMVVIEGNLPNGHQVTVQTAMPTSFWRLANVGTPPSKDSTAQFTEQCGSVENWSVIDKKVAEMGGNAAGYRAGRAPSHVESLKQEVVGTLIYGAATAPEEFIGLANRYNSTSAGNGSNVILAGGSGASDMSSIYLVGWGDQAIHMAYPKGSGSVGIDYKDYGLQVVASSISGNQLEAYRARWAWDLGLCVADWRYAVRIANIDMTNLKANSSAADLTNFMIQATHMLPDLTSVKPAFYMNRGTARMLDFQNREDVITGGGLRFENVAGDDGLMRRQYSFRGIPVRIIDQLTETEAVIS